MPLTTKCIKAPRGPDDGIRISIMSRHTLNDGRTPDPDISHAAYDQWWQDLAPPPQLLGDYYKRGLPWQEFERRFQEYLQQPTVRGRLRDLAILAGHRVVTIMCAEETPEHCHRRLVAEACWEIDPSLEITIR